MAFTVTPTSGDAPYILNADISNKLGFELGLYSLELRNATNAGSCPAPIYSGGMLTPQAVELLTLGTTTITTPSVPTGSCRIYTLLVRNIVTGSRVSEKTVSINNV